MISVVMRGFISNHSTRDQETFGKQFSGTEVLPVFLHSSFQSPTDWSLFPLMSQDLKHSITPDFDHLVFWSFSKSHFTKAFNHFDPSLLEPTHGTSSSDPSWGMDGQSAPTGTGSWRRSDSKFQLLRFLQGCICIIVVNFSVPAPASTATVLSADCWWHLRLQKEVHPE